MARLKSRHHFPPHGWKFYQPQTCWELPDNLSFNGAVDAIIQHRIQSAAFLGQYHLSTDIISVGDEVDAYNAARCKSGGWDHFVEEVHSERMAPQGPPIETIINDNTKADVVQLRRNGDIICILPILHKVSQEIKRPVRLVVAKEYVDLLDGVSYAQAVRWDGDWEDPMAAARHFSAQNAQAYGFRSGINYDPRDGHFAEVCWRKLGYVFDNNAPLIFDRRSPEREQALIERVFKTEKPKILINMIGYSSPLLQEDIDFVTTRIYKDFGPFCEIIDMKDLRAERLYDLIGLMDRANVLVTADTATLWLAHASMVPNVLISRGSPKRGNCKCWVEYQFIKERWMEIAMAIRSALRR